MSRKSALGALTIALALAAEGPAPGVPAQTVEEQKPAEGQAISELPVEQLERMARWLARRGEPMEIPSRDIFAFAAASTSLEPLASSSAAPAPSLPDARENEQEPEARLAGFLRRTDPGGGERSLALLRLGNESWLVREGDEIGPYRVEKIVVGQEIHLAELATGRRVRLSLDE